SVGTIQLGDLPNLANTFWSLRGNAGTTPGTNFLGTTHAQPLVLKTNNVEALRIDELGRVGVGTAKPGAQLSAVSAGGIAASGITTTGIGLVGAAEAGGVGVSGLATTGNAVQGLADSGAGVFGRSNNGQGVVGTLGGLPCTGSFAVGGCVG